MRNHAMTIPGANWWGSVALAVTDLTSRIPQLHVGRHIREAMLLLGILAFMSISAVGSIVLVACTVAEAVAGVE